MDDDGEKQSGDLIVGVCMNSTGPPWPLLFHLVLAHRFSAVPTDDVPPPEHRSNRTDAVDHSLILFGVGSLLTFRIALVFFYSAVPRTGGDEPTFVSVFVSLRTLWVNNFLPFGNTLTTETAAPSLFVLGDTGCCPWCILPCP